MIGPSPVHLEFAVERVPGGPGGKPWVTLQVFTPLGPQMLFLEGAQARRPTSASRS